MEWCGEAGEVMSAVEMIRRTVESVEERQLFNELLKFGLEKKRLRSETFRA